MAAPNLTAVDFPKLHSSPNKDSNGTVTGTGITKGDTVTIESKNSGKVWVGKVGDPVTGQANTFNATVHRVRENYGTETVGVTVTNTNNEESNEKQTTSEVVP
jgi:hypothetical protein